MCKLKRLNECSLREVYIESNALFSVEEDLLQKSLLIIGAGGIGTTVVDLLVPALARIQLGAKITLMDGDTVEASNLGHQNYSKADIGTFKVDALARKWSNAEGVQVHSVAENLRNLEQLDDFDLVVVCVDRPEPRRLVHSLDVPWVDLRCSGDGWMVFTSDSDSNLVDQMTPDHEPKSCQVEGALDAGNLEFGFSIAGTFGAQWVVQHLRGNTAPVQSMGSLTYGTLNFPTLEVKA